MADLQVSDNAIEGAIEGLVAAESRMRTSNAPRPDGGFESLTGIADDIERHLRGMQVARAALADAATTAGRGLSRLMADATTLDVHLATALGAGFAMRRTEQ